MPSSKQRQDVWFGRRAKTSGGLTKADLTKNKRGKIVSKKKSSQADSQNNLGNYLRAQGKKVDKSKMLRKKGDVVVADSSKNLQPKKKAPSAKPKAKPAVQPPKKAAPKKSAPAKPKPKPRKPKAAAAKKPKSKINPLTQQPYAKKSASGYVADAKVHLDNVKLRKRKEKVKAPKATQQDIDDFWAEL